MDKMAETAALALLSAWFPNLPIAALLRFVPRALELLAVIEKPDQIEFELGAIKAILKAEMIGAGLMKSEVISGGDR